MSFLMIDPRCIFVSVFVAPDQFLFLFLLEFCMCVNSLCLLKYDFRRTVKAEEALKIQLATCYPPSYETVSSTPALEQALTLAALLAQHPQVCMRNDRLSTHLANPIREAMLKEYELGLETLTSGEFVQAITKFFEATDEKKKDKGKKASAKL